MVKIKEIVRVGINANFNCTKQEFIQVDGFDRAFPDKRFFVNSNIVTPNLLKLNSYKIKSVITVNPNLVVKRKLVKKLYKLKKSNIAFVRVKYIPNDSAIKDLIEELSDNGYKVVITVMRFRSNKTVAEYDKANYDWNCNWFRLRERHLVVLKNYDDSLKNVYICDREELGCQGCGLCEKLTFNKGVDLSSLNMSSSGICPHNCIDCFAKYMQRFSVGCGHSAMVYDVIKKNIKQQGKTAFIKKKMAN